MIILSKLVTDVKLYAKLLKSVGVQGSGQSQKRPLTPVECAEYIQRLIDEEKLSYDKIAGMLGLGKQKSDKINIYKKHDTTQLTDFLHLLNVSEKSKSLIGWYGEEYPKIPFSVISQMHKMTPHEQDLIIQSILKNRKNKTSLGKEDVKKIRKWRNENPDLFVSECIEKILNLKPVEITNIVVCDITPKLKEIMKEDDYKEHLLDILRKNISGKFYSIDSGKSVIALSMDDEAYQTFHNSQYNRGVSFSQFLDKLLEY